MTDQQYIGLSNAEIGEIAQERADRELNTSGLRPIRSNRSQKRGFRHSLTVLATDRHERELRDEQRQAMRRHAEKLREAPGSYRRFVNRQLHKGK
jgi:hypothetical protein